MRKMKHPLVERCWKDYKKNSFPFSSREDDVFVHYEWIFQGSVWGWEHNGVAATIQFSYTWETL